MERERGQKPNVENFQKYKICQLPHDSRKSKNKNISFFLFLFFVALEKGANTE